jgi:hypothetical protein
MANALVGAVKDAQTVPAQVVSWSLKRPMFVDGI